MKTSLDPETLGVRLEKEAFIFTARHKDVYEIDRDQVKDEASLIHWTIHLCEKPWVEKRMLEGFLLFGIAHLKEQRAPG